MLHFGRRTDAPTSLELGRRVPLVDASGTPVGEAEIALRTNPNTGALEFRAPLTWTGVRRYRHADGTVTRELRRPEQVRSESHRRGLRLLTATPDHPALPDGTPVYLDARGGPGVFSPDGSALRPAADYQCGYVGDSIEDGEIDGYYVPIAWCSVTSAEVQRRIAAGRTQTSLGYTALLDVLDSPGVWDGPHGPEEYDVEHVLDHDDPRVQAAVEAGVLPVVDLLIDGQVRKVPAIGPNHFAEAIWRGRGEAQSEIIDFASGPRARADAAPSTPADAAPLRARGGFVAVVADAAPQTDDARVQRAARTARLDMVSACRMPVDLAAFLSTAPLTGHYTGVEPCAACGAEAGWNVSCAGCFALCTGLEWAGWVEPAAGCPGAGGIAFVAVDGLGLWWASRESDGGVLGDAIAFAWRGPATPPAGLPAAPSPSSAVCALERPRLFSMVRCADESGVSGTGHVLDGVVWRSGKVSAAWDTEHAPGSVVVYDCYSDFLAIHVDQHPGNGTVIAFDDGCPAPAPIADYAPTEHSDGVETREHAARQASPGKFDKFLRFAFPDGAPSMILGRKGDGPWQVQSVRFPAALWSVADAKQWCKDAGLRIDGFVAAMVDSADVGAGAGAEATPEFQIGDRVTVLAEHMSGLVGVDVTIAEVGTEPYYAVTLPDGTLHRWFSQSELKPASTSSDNGVSFVAPKKSTPYAHDVRGDAADARYLTMKLRIPSRLVSTANAVAQAAKVPAPVKVSDAMLEIELPDGAPTPEMISAVLQALAAGTAVMAEELAGAEQKAEQVGADYAASQVEMADLKTAVADLNAKVDALTADAEEGRAARRQKVVDLAKKFAGLVDSDVDGKDADAVRVAAVSKRYPNAKHLDTRSVTDALWDAMQVDAPKVVPSPAAPALPPLERPAPVRDSAGDVVDAPKPARKLTLHAYG